MGHSPTLRLGVGVDGARKPELSDEQVRGGVAREARGKWLMARVTNVLLHI